MTSKNWYVTQITLRDCHVLFLTNFLEIAVHRTVLFIYPQLFEGILLDRKTGRNKIRNTKHFHEIKASQKHLMYLLITYSVILGCVCVYRYEKERNINELCHNSTYGYENNRNSPVYRCTRTAFNFVRELMNKLAMKTKNPAWTLKYERGPYNQL